MNDAGLIAGHYELDAARPALQIAGRRGYEVLDRREAGKRLVALAVEPYKPMRSAFLTRAVGGVPNAMMPVDQGPGLDPGGTSCWFVLCLPPPGGSIASQMGGMQGGAWPESEIITALLLPAAAALKALAEQGLTHRAIRPGNVFRAGRGEKAVLGPCWTSPPGSEQPPAFEPPYSAMCHPHGRGEGAIADDVYALAVTMLWCALGGAVNWPDTPAMTLRKLEHGSLDALCTGRLLSPTLMDLLRVMMADDPDHRPSPTLLQDPTQARARRVATRPPQRANRPVDVGGLMVSTARELAFAIACAPEAGEALIRSGAGDRWLRRTLGDTHAAVALDEAVFRRGSDPEVEDSRSHAMLVMRAVAALYPQAPMVWRGYGMFPDGVAGMAAAALAPAAGGLAASMEELVTHEVLTHWAAIPGRKRNDVAAMIHASREWRGLVTLRGPTGGVRRLAYQLNGQLACASPLVPPGAVVRLTALLAALEQAASGDRTRPPVDGHIVAFIAAHADVALLAQMAGMDGFALQKERLAALNVYARLQQGFHGGPMPGFAQWLLEAGLGDLRAWRNLRTRAQLGDSLKAAAEAGELAAMLVLLRNDSALQADHEGGENAARQIEAMEEELRSLAGSGARRAAEARRQGHEVAAAIGLMGLIVAASLIMVPE